MHQKLSLLILILLATHFSALSQNWVWAQRMGTMGQQGVDFQPAPYRLSRGMITRISGLIAQYRDVNSLIG
jgi:hypothetical protein